MQPITSGTTTERIVRTALVTLLFSGYAGWSIWDGFVGYPRANLESALREKIGVTVPAPLPQIRTDISAATAETIQTGMSRAELSTRLGDAGLMHDEVAYFFAAGGHLAIETRAGAVSRVAWVEGPKHKPSSIGFQKLIGFVLLPVGVGWLIHLVRTIRTRATLTADGLKAPGHPLVPFDAMQALQQVRPGRFEVAYRLSDREGVVRLDDYVIKQAPAIVQAIREKKGFADPLAADEA